MELKNLLKRIVMNCFLIIGGSTVCATVFCAVFSPDFSFAVKDLCSILLIGFLCSLTFFVTWSRRELTKKSLIIREILQCVLVYVVIFSISYYNSWIDRGSVAQPVMMFLLVAAYYAAVCAFNFRAEHKTAAELNKKLQQFREKE